MTDPKPQRTIQSRESGKTLGKSQEGGSGLPARSQAGDVEIARSEWVSFFDSFSRQHQTWLASISVVEDGKKSLKFGTARLKVLASTTSIKAERSTSRSAA